MNWLGSFFINVELKNLTIGYKGKVVQRDLSLDLADGQLIALLGPNGSGKSTLLRTLAGLLPALSGQVLIEGRDVTTMTPSERAKKQALVLTESETLDATTVHDVVAMGRYPYTSFLGHLTEEDETIIRESLEAVGFTAQRSYSTQCGLTGEAGLTARSAVLQRSGLTADLVCGLSSGTFARVQLARALAQQAPIILLDEPTAHLDLPGRIQLFELLQRLAHEQKKLILISTHELDLALRFSDQCLLFSENGVEYGSPEQLRQTSALNKAFKMSLYI